MGHQQRCLAQSRMDSEERSTTTRRCGIFQDAVRYSLVPIIHRKVGCQRIDQLQFTGDESVSSSQVKIKTNFNHPVKELVWVVQPEANITDKKWNDFTHSAKNPVVEAQLQLNGHDRFSKREGKYFNIVQPFQAHTNVPREGINVYSFALRPEEHQPKQPRAEKQLECNNTEIIAFSNTLVASDRSIHVPQLLVAAW